MTWITVKKYADARGVTRQAVERHIKSGKIPAEAIKPKKPGGKVIVIDADLADASLIENLDSQFSKIKIGKKKQRGLKDVAGIEKSLNDARMKKEYFAAALKQLELEEKKGELIKLADVERQSFEISRQIRDQVLNMKHRILDEIASVLKVDPDPIEEILDREINNALEVLSR